MKAHERLHISGREARERNETEAWVLMLLIALWIGLSVTTAMLAGQRGRSPVGWFCLSLLISPFVALPLVLVKPPLVSGREARPPAGR